MKYSYNSVIFSEYRTYTAQPVLSDTWIKSSYESVLFSDSKHAQNQWHLIYKCKNLMIQLLLVIQKHPTQPVKSNSWTNVSNDLILIRDSKYTVQSS